MADMLDAWTQERFVDAASEMQRTSIAQRAPHVLLRPAIFPDGNQWCALYGKNLQEGVTGFGDTPELAAADFDHQWCTQKIAALPKGNRCQDGEGSEAGAGAGSTKGLTHCPRQETVWVMDCQEWCATPIGPCRACGAYAAAPPASGLPAQGENGGDTKGVKRG